MWMRLLATTRSPASSSILVTAPVRLRRVASGLMIEKVRVTAMGISLQNDVRGFARAPSGRAVQAQGSGLLDPLAVFLRVIAARHVLAAVELAPGGPGRFGSGLAEQQENALEGLGLVAPRSVGKHRVARAVQRPAFVRQ